MVLGNLIGGFITIVVGVNLIPIIADRVVDAQTENGTNITGASSTILGLTTLFFAIGIMAAAISLATTGLRNAGLV